MPDVHTSRPLYWAHRYNPPFPVVMRGYLSVTSLMVSPLPSHEEGSLTTWPMSVN